MVCRRGWTGRFRDSLTVVRQIDHVAKFWGGQLVQVLFFQPSRIPYPTVKKLFNQIMPLVMKSAVCLDCSASNFRAL